MVTKYIHTEDIHNYTAARETVPFILNLFNPKSVADMGCGIGTWLRVFQENGINDVLGIDGDYVNKSLLKIDPKYFIPFNLEEKFTSDRKFDLVISLEVAEHLNNESSKIFIESLCTLSDIVIFSAATYNQGGQNHINEQEPLFWIELFSKNGYVCYDVLRPVFWENENIDWWYRQNIMIFSKKSCFNKKLEEMPSFNGKNIIHPITDKNKTEIIQNSLNKEKLISSGKMGVKFYLKLAVKAIKLKMYS